MSSDISFSYNLNWKTARYHWYFWLLLILIRFLPRIIEIEHFSSILLIIRWVSYGGYFLYHYFKKKKDKDILWNDNTTIVLKENTFSFIDHYKGDITTYDIPYIDIKNAFFEKDRWDNYFLITLYQPKNSYWWLSESKKIWFYRKSFSSEQEYKRFGSIINDKISSDIDQT